jgi:hypothetical protein
MKIQVLVYVPHSSNKIKRDQNYYPKYIIKLFFLESFKVFGEVQLRIRFFQNVRLWVRPFG